MVSAVNDNGESIKGGNTAKCPMCRAAVVRAFRPFCSKRCADIDLARWLGGTYAVPGPAVEDQDDSAAGLTSKDD